MARSRGEYGQERYEKIEFQVKVAEKFDELLMGLDYCIHIDASKSIDSVTGEISEAIKNLNAYAPLLTLW